VRAARTPPDISLEIPHIMKIPHRENFSPHNRSRPDLRLHGTARIALQCQRFNTGA
jgi:hypothetical protein